MSRLISMLVGALALGSWACGGDGAATGSGTVPEGTTFDDVSEQKLEEICEANRQNVEAVVGPDSTCLQEAFELTQDQAACEAYVSTCKADAPSFDVCDEVGNEPDSGGGFANCGAEVALVESCIADLAERIRGLSCADRENPLEEPQCVNEIDKVCPMLFGSGPDMQGGGGEGGGGGGAGQGGGGEGGGSAGSGGEAGLGAGPSCGPVQGDDACTVCLVTSCCGEITACLDDDDCGCYADCRQTDTDPGEAACLTECSLQSQPQGYSTFDKCLMGECGSDCM